MAHGQDIVGLTREAPDEVSCADVDAFDAFARAQRGDLLKYFRFHLPTEADAQDAAQESLLRLLRYREQPRESWRPLLFRIASNLVGEFYRRNATHHAGQHVPLDEVRLESAAPDPLERIDRRQREALLRAAILALSPRSRQIYLLSRTSGLSYAQIAQRCGITVKAVETSIARTIVELARCVGAGGHRAS